MTIMDQGVVSASGMRALRSEYSYSTTMPGQAHTSHLTWRLSAAPTRSRCWAEARGGSLTTGAGDHPIRQACGR